MSKFVVNLQDEPAIGFGGYAEPRKMSALRKIFAVIGAAMISIVVVAGIAGYFYWQSLKNTPQYSLALMIDAAKRNDQNTVNQLVDTDAVIEDFLPQITSKAVDIYGRGLPRQTIAKVEQIAAPVMPAVKDRAREELPRAIRQKTAEFGNVPFAAMVMGADRYLDIATQGDTAIVKSLLPEHTFEVKMQRSGDKWKIVGLKDEPLATRIAQRIGQEVIAIAENGNAGSKSGTLGIKTVNELLRQAEEIFR